MWESPPPISWANEEILDSEPHSLLQTTHNQPIRLPGLKPEAWLPSPAPAGFATGFAVPVLATGSTSTGLAVPGLETGKGGGKAGVCSGLILSGAFTPICKGLQIGVCAIERINKIPVLSA